MNELMGKWICFAPKSNDENRVGYFACPSFLKNP